MRAATHCYQCSASLHLPIWPVKPCTSMQAKGMTDRIVRVIVPLY